MIFRNTGRSQVVYQSVWGRKEFLQVKIEPNAEKNRLHIGLQEILRKLAKLSSLFIKLKTSRYLTGNTNGRSAAMEMKKRKY